MKRPRAAAIDPLFSIATQSEAKEGFDRVFSRAHQAEWIESAEVEAKLVRQISYDSDLWIVEVEDRDVLLYRAERLRRCTSDRRQ